MDTPITDTLRPARERLPLVDVLRGVALVAMAVYHFSWDLAYHGFVDWDVAGDRGWRVFAALIAASFLALSGTGLVLASRGGLDRGAYLRRLAKIAAAAALVSAATYLVFPDAWIFFGILHMIALGGVLALPFLRLPAVAALAAAGLVAALPALVAPGLSAAPWLAFTGLSSHSVVSNDFVPVFPWFAAVLVGVAAGRAVADGRIRLSSAPPRGLARGLALAGRWSLPIYLIHQPVLFGLVALAATTLPADPAVERARFVAECETACGLDPAACARFCGCVADAMDGTRFFSVRGGDPEMGPLVSTAAMGCRPPAATAE